MIEERRRLTLKDFDIGITPAGRLQEIVAASISLMMMKQFLTPA
jgi:hypothetical protein